MTQFFINNIAKNKENAKTLDNTNRFTNKNPEKRDDKLEIRIISSDSEFQEIEITYGKKKKRVKITRFLPKNLASDYIYQPLATGVGATNLKSLKQSPTSPDLLLKEKLLNVLAKINLLNQGDNEINYQKIWDGPQRIAIDQKFLALSNEQKQEMFDQESAKRLPYLSTLEKAILVAAINHIRPADHKVSRDIVSHTFAEIPDRNLFQEFIKEVFELINDKGKLLQHFFVHSSQNLSPEKNNNLINRVTEIFSEADESKRKHKIHALKKHVDQTAVSVISK